MVSDAGGGSAARCRPTTAAAATCPPLVLLARPLCMFAAPHQGAMTAKKPKGEVHEVINALEHLSAQNGSRADVVQNKRDCFQVWHRSLCGWGVFNVLRVLLRPDDAPLHLVHSLGTGPASPPQKLIRYMTQGIDMSAAFVPATKCVALSKHDLPLKKMLYLYLRTAAKQNSTVALLVVQVRVAGQGRGVGLSWMASRAGAATGWGQLRRPGHRCLRRRCRRGCNMRAPPCVAVQTLLNDCKDLDPTIRGLAVRSMCSLRVPELMENVVRGWGLAGLLAGWLAGACCCAAGAGATGMKPMRPGSAASCRCAGSVVSLNQTPCPRLLSQHSVASACLPACPRCLPPAAVPSGGCGPARHAPVRAGGGGDGCAQVPPPGRGGGAHAGPAGACGDAAGQRHRPPGRGQLPLRHAAGAWCT